MGIGIILSLPVLFFWKSFPEERRKVFATIKSELVQDLLWIRCKYKAFKKWAYNTLHPSRELVRLHFEIRIREIENESEELRNDRDRPIDLKRIRQLQATRKELIKLLEQIENGYSKNVL